MASYEWEVSRFLARWLDEIEEFRFDVEHVPGKLNPADPLSRRGLPAPARPSRLTAFADARIPAKASDVDGLETAPSAVREGDRETGARAFAPLNGAWVQLLAGECTGPAS